MPAEKAQFKRVCVFVPQFRLWKAIFELWESRNLGQAGFYASLVQPVAQWYIVSLPGEIDVCPNDQAAQTIVILV